MDERVHHISAEVPDLTVTLGSQLVKIKDASYGGLDQIVLTVDEALELYKVLDKWLEES